MHGEGCLPDGPDNPAVGTTTANVTLQGRNYLRFVGVAATVEQAERRHYHPWSAVAALESLVVEESLLQGVQLPVALKALYCQHPLPRWRLPRGSGC